MCNLYAVTKGQQAIRELTRAMADRTGKPAAAPWCLSRLRRTNRPQHG